MTPVQGPVGQRFDGGIYSFSASVRRFRSTRDRSCVVSIITLLLGCGPRLSRNPARMRGRGGAPSR